MEAQTVLVPVANVQSVYSGVDGKCCCGCAGKHSTSTRSKAIVVGKINKHIDTAEISDNYVSVVIGARLLIAYFA